MNVDLSQLQAQLNGLGIWGVLIGMALTMLVQRLKQSKTPVLDASIALIRAKHASTPAPAPVSKDIDHDTALQLIGATPPAVEKR